MIFTPLPVEGAFKIEMEELRDERGMFARTFAVEDFAEHGLETAIAHCNVSVSTKRGTLRGMHYQAEPHGEGKLIRCTRGEIFDVAIDVRPGSPTFKQKAIVQTGGRDGLLIYLPRGVAHGFLTLADDTEVTYQMSAPYVPDSARGVRWNDPAFAIEWPEPVRVIADRDASFPDFVD